MADAHIVAEVIVILSVAKNLLALTVHMNKGWHALT
jgi:hypothetical protein